MFSKLFVVVLVIGLCLSDPDPKKKKPNKRIYGNQGGSGFITGSITLGGGGGGFIAGGKPNHGHHQGGHNQGGYNQGGHNQGGYNQGGHNQGGHNQGGYNQGGHNQGGYNQGGHNQGGYNQGGHNQGGYHQGGNSHNAGYNRPGGSKCRYWCKTPQNKFYCCENNKQPTTNVGAVHPGKCPPVRPNCPPVRNYGGPKTCSNDGACSYSDKCCYDTCLQQHVCKQARKW